MNPPDYRMPAILEYKRKLLMALLQDPEISLLVFDQNEGRNLLSDIEPDSVCLNGTSVQVSLEAGEELALAREKEKAIWNQAIQAVMEICDKNFEMHKRGLEASIRNFGADDLSARFSDERGRAVLALMDDLQGLIKGDKDD